MTAMTSTTYSATVMDHFTRPRNMGEMGMQTASVKPPTGLRDTMRLFIKVEGNRYCRCPLLDFWLCRRNRRIKHNNGDFERQDDRGGTDLSDEAVADAAGGLSADQRSIARSSRKKPEAAVSGLPEKARRIKE